MTITIATIITTHGARLLIIRDNRLVIEATTRGSGPLLGTPARTGGLSHPREVLREGGRGGWPESDVTPSERLIEAPAYLQINSSRSGFAAIYLGNRKLC